MLFTQRTGFLNIHELLLGRGTAGDGVINQLKTMGFTEVYSNNGSGISIPADPITGRPEIPGTLSVDVTLEAPADFSLGSQKWRIKFYAKGDQKTVEYDDLTQEILYDPPGSAPPISYDPKQYVKGSFTYEAAPKVLSVFVGSDIQLPNDGTWGFTTNYATASLTNYNISDAAGHLAITPWGTLTGTGSNQVPIVDPPTTRFPSFTQFANRSLFFYTRGEFGDDGLPIPAEGLNPNTQSFRAAPMTYVLSYTRRGLFFSVWNSDTPHTGMRQSWFLIQRSVDRTSGAVRGTTTATATSECPLFCVFGCETSTNTALPKNDYGILVVREKNTSSPGPKNTFSSQTVSFISGSAQAWTDKEDTPIFINPSKQVSFNEEGNYMVTFISELASSRYRYPDELDMVGTISADVIGIGQELQFTVYGETQPRTYIALPANEPFNTGMRLLVLKSNPNES